MEKIIITPLFGMGDTLMTTPALELLKKHRPNTHLTYFTFNKATHAVMENNPHIDNLVYYPIKVSHFYKDVPYVLSNLTGKFDTCINFYPSNRSAYNIFALMTLAKKRIGHNYLNMNFSQMNWLTNHNINENPNLHCIEENIQLLKFFDIDPDSQEIPNTKIYLTDKEVSTGKEIVSHIKGKKLVGVHAGTSTFKGHTNRRWPVSRFIELMDNHPDITFLLFGTGPEVEVNEEIKKALKNSDQAVIIKDISVKEASAVIGECDAFLTNDSGLMHIANAMQTPIIAILGPTNPNFIKPWNIKSKVVRLSLPCSPCFYYSPKPLKCKLNGKFNCLRNLETEKVSKALDEILD